MKRAAMGVSRPIRRHVRDGALWILLVPMLTGSVSSANAQDLAQSQGTFGLRGGPTG